MRALQRAVVDFLKDDSGPTAVEYAVMMALIMMACIAMVAVLGTNNQNTYSYVGTKVGKTAS
jgi:pilus assembly protein Flp/PilA